MLNGHRQTLNAKNFSEAYKTASQKWFPCAPGILRKIRERIVTGYYSDNRKDLLRDLRSDASLFLYSLRRLRKMIVVSSSGTVSAIHDDEPMEPLIDTVSEIVSELTHKEVYHSFDQITDVQAGRYKELILSSSVSDSLADKLSIDRNVGYTCALLRQLGLTLIAWNYPNIYRQSLDLLAAERNGSGATIDSILHSQLGFSPAMLGVRFAEIAGLPDSIVRELDTEQPQRLSWDRLTEYSKDGRPGVVSQLCAIGEAFARANNPHFYPNARDDLARSEKALRQLLGPEATAIIAERTKRLYGGIIDSVLGPEAIIKSPVDQAAGFPQPGCSNIFLSSAPAPLRTRIQQLYEKDSPDRIDESLIRSLIHEIIPLMGFGATVVYTADPTNSALNPVLRVGRPVFNEPRQVNLVSIMNDTNPIRRAYSSGLLVYESGHLRSGEKRSFVASIIGSKVRIGVLYLETGPDGVEEYRTDVVHAAKLLASCLEDLLHLG